MAYSNRVYYCLQLKLKAKDKWDLKIYLITLENKIDESNNNTNN